MKTIFDKKLGFGFLRLPLINADDDGSVDIEAVKRMVDTFISRGFCYFDTGYNYHDHKSEDFLRMTLTERYPRESYMIATKLPIRALKNGRTPADIFEHQLKKCGTDFFDVYLLHGIDREDAELFEELGGFEFLKALKKEGKARYIGFSFHDTADVLDGILNQHPEVDLVQIQLNYLDWENEIIQSRACLEVCRKYGKPVIVMEPVKGGTLANLPQEALSLLENEPPAHRALRFAASREGVCMVLSGMSTLGQVEENTALMADFAPLSAAETDALEKIRRIINSNTAIACTACSYCTDGCPVSLPIPRYFSLYNQHCRNGWQANAAERYDALTKEFSPASSCTSCMQCEEKCPQRLPVASLLKKVSETFE